MASSGWQPSSSALGNQAQLVLVFGGTEVLSHPERLQEIQRCYPAALLFGCSTAGEIHGTEVADGSIVATAVAFSATTVRGASVILGDARESFACGATLAQKLSPEGLTHVLVLSEGLRVNGSELVRGLMAHLPSGVQVTGGLSGDGDRFKRTLVLFNSAPQEKMVAVLGFYGKHLKVGYGSLGGWDAFGPERLVTRSEGNVLYELDNQPALELYKRYLGEYAAGLPGTGLLFPLSVRDKTREVVRTILGVNEQDHSLTFAGDIVQGSYAKLMKANFGRLIEGASGAAKVSAEHLTARSPDLAILISCVGRKLILKQRVEEELEAVGEVLGKAAMLTGFYSYGEICPSGLKTCELHNQTMTITTLAEDADA
jgi:hypothetical protein